MDYALVRRADAVSESGTVSTSASANDENVRDWLLRFQHSDNQRPTYTLIPTEHVMGPVIRVIDENYLLRDVIKNLWNVYKYQQEYQSFLLGGCEEQEFLQIAERYTGSFRHIRAETMTWASSILLDILDNYLTSSDLSVLLNVDPADIEHTLNSSSVVHAVSLDYQETYGEQR